MVQVPAAVLVPYATGWKMVVYSGGVGHVIGTVIAYLSNLSNLIAT